MEAIILIVMSAIVGLIIGAIGFLIGGETGFNYGFWIGFVPTAMLFVYVLFIDDKKQSVKKNSNYATSTLPKKEEILYSDLGIMWKENNYNLDKTLNAMCNMFNIKKSQALYRLDNYFIDDSTITKILADNYFDVDKTISELCAKTIYDENRITKKVNTVAIEITSRKNAINKNEVKNANKNLKMATNTKHAHKENKKKGIVSCPKCGSQSIATTNKKLSATRGVVGGVIGSAVNPVGTAVGAVAGGLSSKKMYNVCQNCGYKWKI